MSAAGPGRFTQPPAPKRPGPLSSVDEMPKSKRVGPEPSPRFLIWSGIFGVAVIVAVIALDYENGWADEATTQTNCRSSAHEASRGAMLSGLAGPQPKGRGHTFIIPGFQE